MTEPITHFGISEAHKVMSGFHKLGNTLLSELLKHYSKPNERKTLKGWRIKEAAQMVNRSEAYLRRVKVDNQDLAPIKKDGIGYYSLELIDKIRKKIGTNFKRPEGSLPMVLAISNFKGGVAKSTTSLHLTHKAALLGMRCLVIDLDPQATLSLNFGYIPDLEVQSCQTITPALIEHPEKIKDVIQKTYFHGIDIIPGNLSLSDLEIQITDTSIQKEQMKTLDSPRMRLKNAIDVIKDQYDIIVLDCGPNLGMITINAVTAANGLLVPIPPMMSDFGSFVTFTGTLESLFNRINKDFDFFRILLTKHTSSKESKHLEILMRQKFSAYILHNTMLNSVEIEKSSSLFSSVYEISKRSTAPYKRVIKMLDAVFEEVFDSFNKIWEAQAQNYESKQQKELVTEDI